MVHPWAAISVCGGTSLLIALLTTGAAEVGVFEVPDCDGFLDLVTGCDNILSTFLSRAVFGTIPQAHPIVNTIMGTMGLLFRGVVWWSIARLARGGG